MTTVDHKRDQSQHPPSDWALWFGVLAGPVIWQIRLYVTYALVPVACDVGTTLPIQIVSGVTLLIVLAGGLVAWRSWRTLGKNGEMTIEGPRSRRGFMALSGMLLSGLFLAVILVEWSTVLFVNPCAMGL